MPLSTESLEMFWTLKGIVGIASWFISEGVFVAKYQISDYLDDTTFALAVVEHLFELIGLPFVIFVLFYFPTHLAIHSNLRQILQSIGLATLVGTITKWLTSLHSIVDYQLLDPKINNTLWAMHDTCRAYYYTVPPLMALERTFATYLVDYENASNTTLLGVAIFLTWSLSFGVLCVFYFADEVTAPVFLAYIILNIFFAAYFIYLYFINRRHYLSKVFQAHSLSDRYQHAENIRLIKPILIIQLMILIYLTYSSIWMILYRYVAIRTTVGRNYWGRFWHLGYGILSFALPMPFVNVNPNIVKAFR
uniref:DUF4328 domain-containing protein n=1 Tax=Panagrellus redivivus TaxID=6233 RepID=A0A7E4UZJ7_PANRE